MLPNTERVSYKWMKMGKDPPTTGNPPLPCPPFSCTLCELWSDGTGLE
jgi:hypothetical protein